MGGGVGGMRGINKGWRIFKGWVLGESVCHLFH